MGSAMPTADVNLLTAGSHLYHDGMASSAFEALSAADQYVVMALAVRDHVPVDELAELPRAELDRRIPGARARYENREQTAARLRQQLGINLESPAHQEAADAARELLRRIDWPRSSDSS
jgi:hypothetical protein